MQTRRCVCVCAGLHRDWMNVCFFLILLKKRKEKERNLIIKREFLSLFKRPFLLLLLLLWVAVWQVSHSKAAGDGY